MIGQVLNKVLLWTLPLAVIGSVLWFIAITNPDARYIGQQWLTAQFHLFFNEQNFQQHYLLPDGNTTIVTASQIANAPFVREAIDHLALAVAHSLWAGIITWLLSIAITLVLLQRSGHTYTKDKSIKGDYLSDVAEVKKLIKQQQRESDLILGKETLPLPHLAELQHFLVHGTTGSGKSTIIKELLDHIRRRGERAIIYDKSCNLVSQFYQPATDKLLNPLDSRSVTWNLWLECCDKSDFENLAAALIPMTANAQDPFWVNAARTIFAAAAYRMRQEKNPKILPLLRYLLTAEIGELQNLLQGTEAESLMSEKTEKTAISIKSVLATYLKSLCYLLDGDHSFSIRQWIQNDTTSAWLFISSLGDKHESLKPLITAWLDIAVNAMLSLPEKAERRIWVILDELGSLQQLPYLTAALAEARKFGGCFIISIQSYAQLAKIYGFEGGREISSLLNTRFLFRVPDPDIAQWSAKNLGETTLEEVREGISYGANTIRDGVSIQRIEREKPVIPASEIMRLEDLTCYVRLAGAYPIVQLHMPYISRKKVQEGFILRVGEPDNLRQEMEQMMRKHVPTRVTTKKQQRINKSASDLSLDPNHKDEMERLLN